MRRLWHDRTSREAFGCLVTPTVFKTGVAGYPGQAGSIPVRFRQRSQATFWCGCNGLPRNQARRSGSGTGRQV